MDSNVVECPMAERDAGACEGCECGGGSLDVLREVRRLYEQRLEQITRAGGGDKLEKQVRLLQSWVRDLVGQNELLASTVEQLEKEITARLLMEKRRHAEVECEFRAEVGSLRRRLARKDGDLRGLLELLRRLRDPAQPRHAALGDIHFNEVTQADIFGPDLWKENQLEQGDTSRNTKEIRRLSQDTEQYEQVILALKKEMSLCKYHTPDVSKVDAEVTADICCPGLQGGEIVPVKDYTCLLRQETAKYQERLDHIEEKVKSSSERVRALREANVLLAADAHALRQLCAALAEQARLADVRARFADHLAREMRRQIVQAKAKLKAHETSCHKVSKDMSPSPETARKLCTTCNSSASGEPVRQPRRALRRRPPPAAWGGRGSADDEFSSRHD